MIVIIDEPRTAKENIAINQACLEAVQQGKYKNILRIYQFSQPGIIISKKQDLWDIREQAQHLVIRRPTGGAAVYVDEHTLGYSHFTTSEQRDILKHYNNLTSKVVNTLKSFGLEEVTCGHWDVRVDDCVVAGHAQQHNGNAVEVHGLLRLTPWNMTILETSLKLRKLVEYKGEKYLLVDNEFFTLQGTPTLVPPTYTILRDEQTELAVTPCLTSKGIDKREFIKRLILEFSDAQPQPLPRDLYRQQPQDVQTEYLRRALGHCFVDLK